MIGCPVMQMISCETALVLDVVGGERERAQLKHQETKENKSTTSVHATNITTVRCSTEVSVPSAPSHRRRLRVRV